MSICCAIPLEIWHFPGCLWELEPLAIMVVQNGAGKDANVTGLFTRVNNQKNTRTYVGKIKMSQEFDGEDLIKGFAGMLAVGKTNGNYQYDLYSIFEDDKYNPNDLGFLYSNNEITNGVILSYYQFNESKRFIDLSTAIEIEHQSLFTDQKFVDFHYQLEFKATLKNYTTVFMRANLNPYEKNDFFEARTGDLRHPLKRSKSINCGGWISTDYRKKLAIDIGGGAAFNPLYNGYGYNWRISPRFRVNDNFINTPTMDNNLAICSKEIVRIETFFKLIHTIIRWCASSIF